MTEIASNQLPAAQFLSSKSMAPDDLLSMIMEGDHRRAQRQRRRGSGKGEDQEREDEALPVRTSKPKKGRANVTCWTCDKVGHYSYECEDPEKSEEEPKDDVKTSNDATTATIESDECGSAWAAEEVVATVMGGPLSISEVTDELDWFESAIAEMDRDLVAKKVPSQDWFDDVVGLGYWRIVRHLIEANYPGCGS